MRDIRNKRIIKNKVQCAKCLDIVESIHTHDFKSCKCGRVSIDGGHEYLRRVGDMDHFIDLSEFGNEEE
jgi:hypothetical protein